MSKGGFMAKSADLGRAMDLIGQIRLLPQAMVVIAGPHGSGKTRLAKAVAEKDLGRYFNLSLTMASYMMAGNLANWTVDFVVNRLSPVGTEKPLILDNIEAVFQPELQLNPLSWFLQIARTVPLVVVWPGGVFHGEFVYSTPNRPDYYHQRDLLVVVLNLDV